MEAIRADSLKHLPSLKTVVHDYEKRIKHYGDDNWKIKNIEIRFYVFYTKKDYKFKITLFYLKIKITFIFKFCRRVIH